MSQVSY